MDALTLRDHIDKLEEQFKQLPMNDNWKALKKYLLNIKPYHASKGPSKTRRRS